MLAHARHPNQARPQGRHPPRRRHGHHLPEALTYPRAGLSHAQWRALSPVEKIEPQLGLSLDQMVEIISRPLDECDAAWMAIKTRVLCVFWAVGAKMIRAWADGTLDRAAACGRARQRDGGGPLG
jgi:hypothetical protein